ncbi:hypothetical protein BCR39DRAFT_556591 [Naematelia encephala]|uniref:Ribosomal protein s17 n=1 Tax=Naematelia encephala TaxID=71784 RepID=A0A1Y2BHE7_9TREE|nr:hypothetical protein BCR39DRAFT_556591 [Naematelia encephala]
MKSSFLALASLLLVLSQPTLGRVVTLPQNHDLAVRQIGSNAGSPLDEQAGRQGGQGGQGGFGGKATTGGGIAGQANTTGGKAGAGGSFSGGPPAGAGAKGTSPVGAGGFGKGVKNNSVTAAATTAASAVAVSTAIDASSSSAATVAISSTSAVVAGGSGKGGAGGKGNKGGNAAASTDTSAAAVSDTTTSAAESSPVAANENGSPGPAVPVLTSNGDLTLDKSLLLTTQSNANATAGQAASAVSNNNFISFCEGKTLTNGQQVKGGSCAVTPLGDIPASTNMVSATFTNPPNMGTIPAGKTFTISLATQNILLGSFTDAQADYYAAPQQVDKASGNIIGHAHIAIQKMPSITSTQVLDPQTFDFFKGMDNSDVNGISSVDVEGGLEAGAYRMCTIMSSSNHASVVLAVAQRGPENTCS